MPIPNQENGSNCGMYVIIRLLHLVVDEGKPRLLDCDLWRALLNTAFSHDLQDVSPRVLAKFALPSEAPFEVAAAALLLDFSPG